MSVEGSENVKKALSAISGLEEALNNAKSPLMQKAKAILDRAELQEQLSFFKDNLPATLEDAGKIVADMEDIIENAKKSADATRKSAQDEADRMIAEANQTLASLKEQQEAARNGIETAKQEAERLIAQAKAEAQQQGEALVERAQQQASAIVSEAQQQARQLVDQETVLRRAQAEAAELTEQTQQQVMQLRQDTFNQLDSAFAKAEQYMGNLMQQMRQSREDMNGSC